MSTIPSGTVTFLFTDIEGSTKLAREHPEKWDALQERHHALMRAAIEAHNGFVFQVIGDAFCAAFDTAVNALFAAMEAQVNLQAEETQIKVRMGLHTGTAERIESGYRGYMAMALVQRVMSAAHGGQILISHTSADLMRGELPEGVTLLDMKEHRLKGLLNPEHLWQAVAAKLPKDFPPLQSLNDIPNNLPIQLTSFIGRENEIAELKRELKDHHLVTLTGSGGTGKTRLSLQVTAEVMDAFPDGVWFLELAPVTDPALVPTTLANLLGLYESGETKQTSSELVCGYLQSRKVLLVFDNCEHLIEACARLANQILSSCKDVRILASSREALGVAGEMAWHVPSLSLPDIKKLPTIEQLSQYEAVRLFIERASLVQAHFRVTRENAPAIAQICFRLDGIPLAIELAAARSNVLAVEQIARRLDDRFRLLTGGARTALPRQQTLRALIDWSYNLLSEEERSLFRRLAIFVGGWTLEAAEAVCSGEGIEPELILDLLSQLVNKSLVVMAEENGESRYHALETIRQYAREKLFENDEAANIRDRHLDHFVQLAEQGFEELRGANDLLWIDKLETENDNLRAALSWSLESPDVDPQKALQLSGALQDFWDTRGYTNEGVQWLSNALKKAPETQTIQRCRALGAIGLLCIRITRYKDADRYYEDCLLLARQLDNTSSIIESLLGSANGLNDRLEARKRFDEGLALARAVQNQPYHLVTALVWGSLAFAENVSEAVSYIREAYDVAERLGNSRLRAFVLVEYGGIEMRRTNHERAASLIQEALRLSELLKYRHAKAHCLLILGRTATRQGLHEIADQYEQQSLQILRDLSDRSCTLECLFHLGWNAYLDGKTDQAHIHLDECYSIAMDMEFNEILGVPAFALGRLAATDGDVQRAKAYYLEALYAHKKSLDSPYFLAYCLEAICAIPGISPGQAARLLGAADAIRQNRGYTTPGAEQPLVDAVIESLQSQIGKEAFESARTAGKMVSVQQAIDAAIDALQAVG